MDAETIARDEAFTAWMRSATHADARTNDYTDDARRDLGAAGLVPIGARRTIAYAWCATERAYHLTDVRSNTRIPTRGRVRLTWPKSYGQTANGACPDVRTGTRADSHNSRVRALA